MSADEVLRVACPTCGAQPGSGCENRQWEIYHATRLMAVDFDPPKTPMFIRENDKVYVSVSDWVAALLLAASEASREGDVAESQLFRLVSAEIMSKAGSWLAQDRSDEETARALAEDFTGQDAWLSRLLVRTLYSTSDDERDQIWLDAVDEFSAQPK